MQYSLSMHRIVLSLLFTAGLGSAEPARIQTTNTGLSEERLKRVSAGMQRYIDQGQVAGTVSLISRRGQIAFLDAQGHMDREAKTPMRTDSIFRLASMTKPIASVALMMLFEEGRFLLNDPVSKYLPEFKDMKVLVVNTPGTATPTRLVPAEQEITIRHLLSHTAGLANTYSSATLELANKLTTSRKPTDTVGDMVKRLAALPLEFQPGSAWQYGPATDVVGRLVEVLSGKTFEQFLVQRIFTPLGMKDTHFYIADDKLSRLTTVYEPTATGTIKPVSAAAAMRGSKVYFSGGGGLSGTAEDYVKFCQMLLNGGKLGNTRLLSPKTVELMTANHIGEHKLWPALPGYRFGLGVRVLTDLGKAAHLGSIGSYGWGGAYGTYFWIDPKEEMIGIVMMQIRPYTQINIRQDFQNLATQAIE
jgi:CubicO group peptidase (beta-lactamase class C family)